MRLTVALKQPTVEIGSLPKVPDLEPSVQTAYYLSYLFTYYNYKLIPCTAQVDKYYSMCTDKVDPVIELYLSKFTFSTKNPNYVLEYGGQYEDIHKV